MRGSLPAFAIVFALLAVGSVTPVPSAAVAPEQPLLLVAFGDSFTAATGVPEGPSASWATGEQVPGGSVAQRLAREGSPVQTYNAAHPGWRLHQLTAQVEEAPIAADVVLVLLGINDLCWTPPTGLTAFERSAREGFDVLARSHPNAVVVVFAIPDLARMHRLHRDHPPALELWSQVDYCRDVFAPSADGSSLRMAALRWTAMNNILNSEARRHGFHFAAGTGWPGFELTDLCGDYFHPNRSGQGRLAAAAWPEVTRALREPSVPIAFRLG